MISRVEIIEEGYRYTLENEINKRLSKGNVKDIKFSVSNRVHGEYYCAMIIYEE